MTQAPLPNSRLSSVLNMNFIDQIQNKTLNAFDSAKTLPEARELLANAPDSEKKRLILGKRTSDTHELMRRALDLLSQEEKQYKENALDCMNVVQEIDAESGEQPSKNSL